MPHQLIESDRAVLAELLKMNVSKQEIARRLGKHRAVAAIESSLNNHPRKRLGYRTAREVLQHYAQRRGVAFDD